MFRKHIEKAFTYRDSLITRYRMDIYDQDGIQEIVVNTTGANSSDGGRDYGEPNAPTTLARQTSDTPIEIQYFSDFKTTWNGGSCLYRLSGTRFSINAIPRVLML